MKPVHLTRSVLIVIWTVAMLGLAVWFLLAWAGHALLSDSSAWLFGLVDPLVSSATWEPWLERLLAWAETLGTVAVWSVWTLGSIGLLLTTVFATLLYARAHRAMSST